MVSIFKAIRDNDLQLLKYFIDLSTGDQHRQHSTASNMSKKDAQWLQKYMKNAGLKYFDLNKRSTKGRTPLQYAVNWNRVEIARMLIDCKHVNVNACDFENGWTALHRCLYLGNIEIATMLMQREDIDVGIKDHEGMTAFELYNSTVLDSFPTERTLSIDRLENSDKDELESYRDHYLQNQQTMIQKGGTDLYTWGYNTNYVLGHPDSENRLRPERVKLQLESHKTQFFMERQHHLVQSVHMSKYHMAILTSEPSQNLLLCGFGRGGRLGSGKELDTQFTPVPVQWPERFICVALGRDHTIAITEAGNVITFGSNQYGQLGYETENQHKKDEVPMQLVPRKVQAQTLKKQAIIGAAASRIHSVVYTRNDIFTWGYNQGQLGYHQPDDEVNQIVPRKVGMPTEIIQVVANDNTTAILTKSHEIILLCNYSQQKLFLPVNRFPKEVAVHRSEVVYPTKLIGSETDYLGAITNTGDIFLWTCRSKKPRNFEQALPQSMDQKKTGSSGNFNRLLVTVSTPKRVWNNDKSHLAAVDVAIGQNGEILICAQSGYVFTGHAESNAYKFSRVPQLQRCIRVCANSSGAFAAIRSEYALPALKAEVPSTLEKDLVSSLPHTAICEKLAEEINDKREEMETAVEQEKSKCKNMIDMTEQQMEIYLNERKSEIYEQYNTLIMATIDDAWQRVEQIALKDETLDVIINVNKRKVYCHSSILRCRSKIFDQLLKLEDRSIQCSMTFKVRKEELTNRIVIYIDSCELAALLLLIDYVYTDQYEHPMKAFFRYPALSFKSLDTYFETTPSMIKSVQRDLITLSKVFALPQLEASAQSSFSHKPSPTLKEHLKALLQKKKGANIRIQLEGTAEQAACHEIIVRQRSSFFRHLLEPCSVWVARRKDEARAGSNDTDLKCITINLDHIPTIIMDILLKYIYLDEDERTIFNEVVADKEKMMLDVLLSTLCEADALLLARLKVITERALIPFIKLGSATSILEHADIYAAENLKQACLKFLTVNLPVFLVSRMLETLSITLIHDIENNVRKCQTDLMPLIPHLPLSNNQINDLEADMEDTEISSSLFALSKGDRVVTTFDEVLVTLYPEKTLAADNEAPDKKRSSITDTVNPPLSGQQSTAIKTGSSKAGKRVRVKLDSLEEHLQPSPISQEHRRSSAGWAPVAPPASSENPSISLREIMETEGQAFENVSKPLKSTSVKKVSQKERKRLAHQQELESMLESSASTSKPVWGKLPAVDVKPVAKIMAEAAESSSSKPSPSVEDRKGKKIYIPEKFLDDIANVREEEETTEASIFRSLDSLGSSFNITPIRRYNFDSNGRHSMASNSKHSLRNIQQQQELEDSWLKGNKPKKNILRIQKEEEALSSVTQFYVQTLDIMTGEWFEVKPVSKK